jgi:hypothetical protein
LEQFEGVERLLFQTLHRERTLLLIERVLGLLADLLERLEQALTARAETYLERHRVLQQYRIPDLSEFVAHQEFQQMAAFRSRMFEVRDDKQLSAQVQAAKDSAIRDVEKVFSESADWEALKKSLASRLDSIMRQAVERLQHSREAAVNLVRGAAQDQYRGFQETFANAYKSLAALDGTITTSQEFLQDPTWLVSRSASQAMTLHTNIGEFEKEFDKSIPYIARAGWMAGRIPNLGHPAAALIVAAGVLLVKGALWAASEVQERAQKNQCRADVFKAIDDYFTQYEKETRASYEKAVTAIESELRQLIRSHCEHYGQRVQELIVRDIEEAADLQARRQRCGRDLDELRQRQQHLAASREHLRKLRPA